MKKAIAIIVLGLLLSGNAYAVCEGNCKNGYGEYTYSDGKYSGYWQEAAFQGLRIF